MMVVMVLLLMMMPLCRIVDVVGPGADHSLQFEHWGQVHRHKSHSSPRITSYSRNDVCHWYGDGSFSGEPNASP